MSVGSLSNKRTKGFTIVELLIVIVVIGILAAIVIVAYNGVQQRARDSRRQNDIQSLTQALELYYLDNGKYPVSSGNAGTLPNAAWSTTADSSWQNLVAFLKPYMGNVPSDPVSTPGVSPTGQVGFNYGYYSAANCGTTGTNQFYILVYRFESSPLSQVDNGTCSSSPVGPYTGVSHYRSMK